MKSCSDQLRGYPQIHTLCMYNRPTSPPPPVAFAIVGYISASPSSPFFCGPTENELVSVSFRGSDVTSCGREVGQLVGTLSPVNHKGLYSIYLLVILLTSHKTIHFFVLQLFVRIFHEPKFFFRTTTTPLKYTQHTIFNPAREIGALHRPQIYLLAIMIHNNACLYSAGTQHGNLYESVTMSRGTYCILRAHTGTSVSHSQHSQLLSWCLKPSPHRNQCQPQPTQLVTQLVLEAQPTQEPVLATANTVSYLVGA